MAKIKQIRYFGNNSQQNSKDEEGRFITSSFLIENIITSPVQALGIRALPGTKFYINDNINPIVISHLGIFEIDFSNGGSIYSLKFDSQSVNRIDSILSQGYIIIDILEKGGNY